MAIELTDLSKTDVVAKQKLYAANEITRIDAVNANNAELESKCVATEGNQTIAGVKTFSSSPVVPAPTTDLQASTKKYADDAIATAVAAAADPTYTGGESHTFGGGLIIKSGEASNGAVSFGTAFPNGVISITATKITTTTNVMAQVSSVTVAGFTITSNGGQSNYWTAIGY